MIVALTGTNRLLVKEQEAKLTADFVANHGELALEKIDAEQASYEQILGAIESLPFLATKKMVVLRDLSLNSQAAESLERLAERAGDSTDLLIVESKLDKRSVYYKTLKKSTQFNEYNELSEQEIPVWLVSYAKELGATLSKADAIYLVERIGNNQLRLRNEVFKLAQYNPAITKATIELLTDENPATTIFNLIDSVFSGNTRRALAVYDEQRKLKVEPQAIHGMLVWQMHAVAMMVSAQQMSPNEIAKLSGVSPYVLQKSQRIAQKMGRGQVIAFMKLLRDIDFKSKRQPLDYDEALKYAIISLSH